MRGIIKAIFPIFSKDQNQQSESQKTNYWLEKLFNQERDKGKGDLIEQIKTQANFSDQAFSDTKAEQTSEEKGLEEAVKNRAGKEEKNRQAVEDMVSNSNRILVKVSSIFPWDLFPTSIIVEETRITIVHRQLFSSQIHCIDIKNISNIFIDSSILFAQLTIVSNTFAENQIIIGRLWKKEAMFIRRVIEGLRMFISHDIDTTAYTVKELINKLKELSTTGIVL